MSGTSLDGVDLALVRFDKVKENYNYELIKARTYIYPEEMQTQLSQCRALSNDELISLHNDWGRFVGELISDEFLRQNFKVDLIASHGHTVFHQPKEGITLQIGSIIEMMQKTGVPTVGDFRLLDVIRGGEGAPLVPIGDRFLFGAYDCCLNLGGIANISFEKNARRLAYDVAPCNLLLNYLAQRLGLSYDDGGQIAATGELNEKLLNQLDHLDFYAADRKPSLGIEYIEKHFYPLLKEGELPVEDLLHTCSLHIAKKIADATRDCKQVLVTGGGAHNDFLLELFRKEGMNIVLPDRQTIDFKEALIFAFLGLRRIENEVNVLCSVTGASQDSCSGQLITQIP